MPVIHKMPVTADILTLLSLLHEPSTGGSVTRRFRGEPVLAWTLRRVRRSEAVGGIAIACWDDQLTALTPVAAAADAAIHSQGPRRPMPHLDAISAARRWADGWRGGPLGTSAFDAGYDPTTVKAILDESGLNAVLLVDPAAALVDPELLSAVVEQYRAKPAVEFTFTPAATGLGGMMLTRPLVDRLAAAHAHPGRLLHYFPDQVSREPIAQDNCAPTPTSVARSMYRYTMSSSRQIELLADATAELNGELLGSSAGILVQRMTDAQARAAWASTLARGAEPSERHGHESTSMPPSSLPREVVLELTTRRATRPIFSPHGHPEASGSSRVRSDTGVGSMSLPIVVDRPDLSFDVARRLIDELSVLDDSRLTLAGVGDPLLHADCLSIIHYAADRGVAVNVETDLLPTSPDVVAGLAESAADIVSVHLPALTADTYAAVMGTNGYAAVLANVQAFVVRRAAAGRATPLVIPLFTKCRQNQHEMEAWYDQWLRAVGSAVIVGPTTYGGAIPDVAAADMSPPLRVPCRRLADRVTVLSDGRYVTCEQDIAGRQPLGRVGETNLQEIWSTRFPELRKSEADNRWKELPVCASCKEWHRS